MQMQPIPGAQPFFGGQPVPGAQPFFTGQPAPIGVPVPTAQPVPAWAPVPLPAVPEALAGRRPEPANAAQFRQMGRLLDQGNLPLFKLASCTSEVRVNPQASMMPGVEMFYRAMSEMVYSRYGLKGTVQRALIGDDPELINNSLVLCSTNVNRMAEQAGVLLNLMRQGATPEVQPIVDMMQRLFQEERANFRQVMEQITQIIGPDAQAANQRVMQALSAIPVQAVPST